MANSPYKILNELEKEYQNNYSASILHLSKAVLKEISDKVKKKKNENFI